MALRKRRVSEGRWEQSKGRELNKDWEQTAAPVEFLAAAFHATDSNITERAYRQLEKMKDLDGDVGVWARTAIQLRDSLEARK